MYSDKGPDSLGCLNFNLIKFANLMYLSTQKSSIDFGGGIKGSKMGSG